MRYGLWALVVLAVFAVGSAAIITVHTPVYENAVGGSYLTCQQSLAWYHDHSDTLGVSQYPAAALHGLNYCLRAEAVAR